MGVLRLQVTEIVFAPLLAGVVEGGKRKRGASAGGDSNHHVVSSRFPFRNLVLAEAAGILVRFCSGGQRFGTARHNELNSLRDRH